MYGLGDSSYERFAYAGKLLHRRLHDLGANPLIEPVFGDERAPDGLEETLGPWMAAAVAAVLPHLAPPPANFQEVSPTELPSPIYQISPVHRATNGHSSTAKGWDRQDIANRMESLALGGAEQDSGVSGTAISAAPAREEDALHGANGVWKPDDWQWATLRRNDRVTRGDWWQEVREFDFELDDKRYVSLAHIPVGQADGAVQAMLPHL